MSCGYVPNYGLGAKCCFDFNKHHGGGLHWGATQAPDLEDEKLFPRAKLIHENQEPPSGDKGKGALGRWVLLGQPAGANGTHVRKVMNVGHFKGLR